MANIEEYLLWRGDLTVQQAPFNNVDNLILSNLSYLIFKGIVPELDIQKQSFKRGAVLHYSFGAYALCILNIR